MTPGLYTDIRHAKYHADDVCESPTLSASIAHKLVTKSPLHAWWAHPRLGNGEREDPTAEQDRGALVHRLLLKNGPEIVAVDANDWRTNAAKEKREAAWGEGKLPVLRAKLNAANELADDIEGRLRARGIVLDGQSEVTAVWKEGDVWCRGRLDHWKAKDALIVDLKFLESADPDAFVRHAINFGCDIQAHAYTTGMELLHPELAGRVQFIFAVIESEPPHPITLIKSGGSLRELGRRKWKRAVETWGRCLSTKVWPAYSADVVEVQAPEWALAKDMEKALSGLAGGSQDVSF